MNAFIYVSWVIFQRKCALQVIHDHVDLWGIAKTHLFTGKNSDFQINVHLLVLLHVADESPVVSRIRELQEKRKKQRVCLKTSSLLDFTNVFQFCNIYEHHLKLLRVYKMSSNSSNKADITSAKQ